MFVQSRKLLWSTLWLTLCAYLACAPVQAQTPLGAGPWYFDTAAPALRIKVSVLARGIAHPWGMVFLPSGNILIAERAGQFRLLQADTHELTHVSGAPAIDTASTGGLMDIALHPDFANNRLVYFTYVKSGTPPTGETYYSTTALARGTLNAQEDALLEVADIFVANAWSTSPGGHGSRLLFAPDGTLFMSSPFRRDMDGPQNRSSHIGKLLRLNPDGSAPRDNPFVGEPGVLPEIWSLGHRAMEGMAFHPLTGELWTTEHGPQGGDEVNIIQPGNNYGWPLVSYGRDYDGTRLGALPGPQGLQEPHMLWVPSIAPSGTLFYTGAEFPEWQNQLFVGSLMTARLGGTGHIERVEPDDAGGLKRERLLTEFKQRIRDIQQGPDGRLYVLTEETDGALLVLERADEQAD